MRRRSVDYHYKACDLEEMTSLEKKRYEYLNEYDAISVLEDDIIVSPGYYQYMKQAVKCYKENMDIAGISLYSHKMNVNVDLPFVPEPDGYDVFFMQFAQSWGQIWMREQWFAFREWYLTHAEEPVAANNVPGFVSGWPKTSWLKYHIKYCIEKNVPITPGTSSPSDIEQAIELGLEVVKFFPAEQSGGLAKIKAMAAPYVNMKFMPTGGINAKNLTSYLDFPKIIACGGSWMVPGDLIKAGEWDKIEQLTREAVQTMLGFELAHVGVNCENEEEALKAANRFAFLFGMPAKVGNSSIFAGTALEVMKEPYLGKNGHIAIRTNYIDRAVNYMETVLGVEFNEESAKRDAKGALKAIYLKEEIGGFAVHLVQK